MNFDKPRQGPKNFNAVLPHEYATAGRLHDPPLLKLGAVKTRRLPLTELLTDPGGY